ncbi:hypothetical protein K435DRAFT_828941 [Dendrothele bispora CBS 962.96]|uniref:Uncharacterized protein n=1 Tax=Dendrothele bispora (strain CBS 962.96) TaxID=1314807 RepID=A0A4S8M293_DENBC|nr:hypothetical protein K435DRAFT_828941 [Dendrothele bispora CBS 962.96]
MFSRTTAATALTLAALAAVASADFGIQSPGGDDLWWALRASINNPDKTLLTDRLAIIAQQNNFDCSKLITQDQVTQAPGKGYTIQLADILNNTHIYAESQPFEIKALGSAYPATTVSASPSQTGGSAGGSGTATAEGSNNTNSAAKTVVGYGAAAIGVLMGLIL